eukprot:141733_1
MFGSKYKYYQQYKMQSLIITLFWLIYNVQCEYNMAPYITCWENNNENPKGFTDPIWINNSTEQCINFPQLCTQYQTQGPNPGKGDVCDHSIQNQLPNMCYFNVVYLPQVDPEKSWTYKCWHDSLCPIKDLNGKGVTGCLITAKRISCCCNEADYCNGQELFTRYAAWGRADHFPPNFTEIGTYNHLYPLLQSVPPSTSIPIIQTHIPSKNPTISPTNIPSNIPSNLPSILPIIYTNNPTLLPSKYPSELPSFLPSIDPTSFPTDNPSNIPTNTPSIYPTLIPSIYPTVLPTNNPSILPSFNPSNIPTNIPTNIGISISTRYNPSITPICDPSINPTNSPINVIIESKTEDSNNYSLLNFDDSTTVSIIYGLIGGGVIGLLLGILLFVTKKYCKQKQNKKNIKKNKKNVKNKKYKIKNKKNKPKRKYDNVLHNEQIEESIDGLESSENGKLSIDGFDKKFDDMNVPIMDQGEDKVDIVIDDESETSASD